MKIVQGDQVAPQPAVQHRGGGLSARILLEGTPGTPGNFQLSMAVTHEDFVSPRHRHNFEQFRCVLEGEFDFGRDGRMTPGTVAYFPEGAYYGPQTSANNTLATVLQFGGLSGGGYLSGDEVAAGMNALKAVGTFEKGVFRRHPDQEGRRNQDAFEAIWEHRNGRPLVYPSSTHTGPVMMDPADQPWSPLSGAQGAQGTHGVRGTQGVPGVSEKRLGRFAANRTGARLLRLDAGAAFRVAGRGIFLALSGDGTVEGQPLRRLTALHLEEGEAAEIAARESTVLLHYELPDPAGEAAVAEAALQPVAGE